MWERFRSPASGGGAAGAEVASASRPDTLSHTPGRESPSVVGSRLDWKGRGSSPFAPASQPSSNPSTSWQPRSSVIAARGGQQRQGSSETGAYQFAGKGGPPPPRPPREFEDINAHRTSPQEQLFPPPLRSQTLPVPPLTTQRHGRRESAGRPASSIYSQPSPLTTDFPSRRHPDHAFGSSRDYSHNSEDVSPPSSPEMDRTMHMTNHDISPIDEEEDVNVAAASTSRSRPPMNNGASERRLQPPPNMSARAILPSQRMPSRQGEREQDSFGSPQSNARSNIPMMRRERRAQRAQRDAETAAGRARPQDGARMAPPHGPRTTSRDGERPRGQKDPRWDPMTGEVTSSAKGRPSQVKPVEYARGLGISTMASNTPASPSADEEEERRPPRSNSRTDSRTGATSGSKVSATDPAATAFTANKRPGWRGASGRTAIVDPVKDNTEVPPLMIPPRSSKRSSPSPFSTEPANADGGVGIGRGAAGVLSPPITPETLNREQPEQAGQQGQMHQQAQQLQQMGGGGSAGKPQGAAPTTASAAKASLASTLRRIMPSSSSSASSALQPNGNKKQGRFFGRDDNTAGSDPNQNQAQGDHAHGYPSPPLSGDPTVSSPGGAATVAGGVTTGDRSAAGVTALPVRTDSLVRSKAPSAQNYPGHASNAANVANFNASPPASAPDTSAPAQRSISQQVAPASQSSPINPQSVSAATDRRAVSHATTLRTPSGSGFGSESGQTTPTTIRRKEVGSAILVGPFPGLNATGSFQHKPHESFSSSVYSRPDDDGDHDNAHLASYPASSELQLPRQPSNAIRLSTKNLPSLPGANNDPNSLFADPPSRFSITTYATSANTSSPRASTDADAPPLPTPPKDITLNHSYNTADHNQSAHGETMSATNGSVLERRRPEMRGGFNKWDEPEGQEEPVKISLSKAWMTTAGANSAGINAQNSPPRSRKEPPRGPRDPHKKPDSKEKDKGAAGRGFGFSFLGPRSPPATSDSNSNSSRPASILSNVDKDLPPAPSQAPASATSTGDRINQLNSLLQDLANRRLNINRAIRQMTELMPQDNLMLPDEVRRKRELEKRKIEELNLKLADIGREEYDLGMKLHRAYKKLDQQTEYEPTTLWVRRATGS